MSNHFSIDTNALSNVLRKDLGSAFARAVGRSRRGLLLPGHVLDECMKSGSERTARLMALAQEVATATGVVIVGAPLYEQMRTEVWSRNATVGYWTLEDVLGRVARAPDRAAEQVRAFFEERQAIRARAREDRSLNPLLQGVNFKDFDGRGLLRLDHELLAAGVRHLLNSLGESVAPSVLLRNPTGYPSLMTWVALTVFDVQVQLVPADKHTQFPEDLRILLKRDDNHDIDAHIAAASALSAGLITDDRVFAARLNFLRESSFPVPALSRSRLF